MFSVNKCYTIIPENFHYFSLTVQKRRLYKNELKDYNYRL